MPFATKRRKGFSRPKEEIPFDVAPVNRSIDNARLRIQDAGFDPGDTDKRNAFEKFTNLPQGQNAFFDALELISRPGQAILNVIDKRPEQGENIAGLVGRSAWRGFAGRDRVRGSKIVEDIGVTNPVGKAVLGTGLEIATDPISFIPGGVIAKGVKSVAKPVFKGFAKGYKAIEPQSIRAVRENTIQPALERGKDALGRAFVPDFKLDEDLFGRTDDTLLKAKQSAENDIRFRTEESARNVADAAKLAGGIDAGADVGRVMEAPLKQFDEKFQRLDGSTVDDATVLRRDIMERQAAIRSGKLTDDQINQITKEIDELDANIVNPIQTELPREARDLSSDPNIRQAADNLVQSNKEIRQWAIDNGVSYKELEGYMKHVLSAAERAKRKNMKSMPIDRGNFGTGQPDKKILSERKLPGSVEDVNERLLKEGRIKEGETFFEPNAFFASAIGQKQLIEYVNAVKFRREVLSNPNFATAHEKGMPIPNNAVVIDTNNYKFLTDEAAEELGLADEIGGEYVTTKAVKQALDRYKKLTTDEGINAFVKAFDTAQSFWKRTTLFSLPYHLRNAMGAMFNNHVGGMNPASLVKYTGQSYPEVMNALFRGKESELFREFREQGLGSTSLSGIEFARKGEDAEKAIERTINKRSQFNDTIRGRLKVEGKDILKNPINAFDTSREFGDFIDQVNRFALYKWSKDKGLDAEQAAKKVREVQFDYSKTTPFEKEIATRVIPFYRWMRNNLPFQIRQFINDPSKYANINKLRLNATDAAGFEEEDIPDWMREQFVIPVYGKGDSGKALGMNLPLADLIKVTDPIKMLLDSTTQLGKLPAEVALNRNFFFDDPIQDFEGQQRQFEIPESILGVPIPGGGIDIGGLNQTITYILEQLGGQPVRQTTKLLERPDSEDQARKFKDPVLGISSLLRDINPQQSEFFRQREELQTLMDLIDYIEQQTGSRPRGVNDIR